MPPARRRRTKAVPLGPWVRGRDRVRARASERGQALFLVVVTMVLVVAVGGAMLGVAQQNTRRAYASRIEADLGNAARAGLAQGKFALWDRFVAWNGAQAHPSGWNPPGNYVEARDYLDNQLAAQNPNIATNLADGATVELFTLRFAPDMAGAGTSGLPIWVRVTAERHDVGRDTYVVLRSEATNWDTVGGTVSRASAEAAGIDAQGRVSELVLRFGGGTFQGFSFALLANAVNCTFCHADIDNVERVFNTDPSLYGTFHRVKVAALETMELRPGADSVIAGTLYSRGILVDTRGNQLDPATSGAFNSSGLQTVVMDANGLLDQDPSTGALTPTRFAEATKDGSGNYNQANASFYQNYPTDPALQVDGALPDRFPPVIPDNAGDDDPSKPEYGNRIIDDAEWNAHTSLGGFTGSISGGESRTLVPNNANYTQTRLPDGSGSSGFDENALVTGVVSGKSAFLVGSDANPLVIDGKVAFDGDVFISGTVKGKGQILARGNIYILGDLKYADGTDGAGNRTFGLAADGTTENLVAYAAGGNIVHGAYLMGHNWDYRKVTGERGDRGQSSGSWALQEIGWWNRTEFTRAMPYYDRARRMPTADPGDPAHPNPPNSGYIPGYKPRFYTIKDGGTVWLFAPDDGFRDYSRQTIYWDNDKGYWVGDGDANTYRKSMTLDDVLDRMKHEHDHAGTHDPLDGVWNDLKAKKYVQSALDPKIMDQDTFRQLQLNEDRSRSRGKFQLDGLFYTANGMLFMSRSNESGQGRIQFNGAVVAADTGILAGHGVELNYDARTATENLLNVVDNSVVEVFVVAERHGVLP